MPPCLPVGTVAAERGRRGEWGIGGGRAPLWRTSPPARRPDVPVAYPSRVVFQSRVSESHIRVTHPSRTSESRIRVANPSLPLSPQPGRPPHAAAATMTVLVSYCRRQADGDCVFSSRIFDDTGLALTTLIYPNPANIPNPTCRPLNSTSGVENAGLARGEVAAVERAGESEPPWPSESSSDSSHPAIRVIWHPPFRNAG